MRLRGGVKRAVVSTDDGEEDTGEDDIDEESGSGAISALKGVFANVSITYHPYNIMVGKQASTRGVFGNTTHRISLKAHPWPHNYPDNVSVGHVEA